MGTSGGFNDPDVRIPRFNDCLPCSLLIPEPQGRLLFRPAACLFAYLSANHSTGCALQVVDKALKNLSTDERTLIEEARSTREAVGAVQELEARRTMAAVCRQALTSPSR